MRDCRVTLMNQQNNCAELATEVDKGVGHACKVYHGGFPL